MYSSYYGILAHGITVNNGYLSPEGNSHSTRGRSSSVTPSERSSISAISRITIVENNPELASYHGPETHDSYKVTTKVTAPKYSWFEHLLGLFCINVAERKEPIMQVVEREHVQSMEPEIIEVSRHHLTHSRPCRTILTFVRSDGLR
jgi:hypothetical protein